MHTPCHVEARTAEEALEGLSTLFEQRAKFCEDMIETTKTQRDQRTLRTKAVTYREAAEIVRSVRIERTL